MMRAAALGIRMSESLGFDSDPSLCVAPAMAPIICEEAQPSRHMGAATVDLGTVRRRAELAWLRDQLPHCSDATASV